MFWIGGALRATRVSLTERSIDATTEMTLEKYGLALGPLSDIRGENDRGLCPGGKAPNSTFARNNGRVVEGVVDFPLTKDSSVAKPTDDAPSPLVDCYVPEVLVAAPKFLPKCMGR